MLLFFSENGVFPALKDESESERAKDCSQKGQGYSCLNKVLSGK